MSAAKKKQVSQNELRLLMLKQKLQTQRVKKKIDSPLAKYPFVCFINSYKYRLTKIVYNLVLCFTLRKMEIFFLTVGILGK